MRPIFIGGCPRSGTTLLGGLLGAHPRCVCIPEMQFKLHLFRDLDWTNGRVPVADVVRKVSGHWRFHIWETALDAELFWRAWKRPPAEALERNSVTYREAVEGVVRVYAAAVGAEEADVWLDHTPGNIRRANLLLDRFPDAKVIHLVRDGRAVANSVVPLLWGPNTVWEVTDWWPQWLAYGLAAEARHPDRVRQVRFERLVRRPADVLRRLCGWLGLEAEPGLGRETEFEIPRFTRGQHRLVAHPPDPERADAWARALSARQIEMFESSAGELLLSLGYPLRFGARARRPTTREKARGEARRLVRTCWNRLRRGWRIRWLNRSRGGPRRRASRAAGRASGSATESAA